MGSHLERARILIQQGRHQMAEEALRLELATVPDEPLPHALLALCLSERGQHASAMEEGRTAIGGAPDRAYFHYVLGMVLSRADRSKEAIASVEEAIRLDPEDADSFALLAALRFDEKDWKGALEAAELGLAQDPEHTTSTNMRAMALTQLGRGEEAGLAIGTALEREPENALTHANRGRLLLHQGDYKQAMESFREALRIDPELLEWAREGIVTALKAHNVIYGAILRYYLWMSKLGSRLQWGIIIGAVVLMRLLRYLEKENPEVAPYTRPIFWAYLAFCLLSWTADPLFNLLLRLHPLGRHALSRKEVVASNIVGGLLLAAIIFFGAALASGSTFLALTAAGAIAMSVPVAATFNSDTTRRAKVLGLYTVALAVLGLASFCLGLGGLKAASVTGSLFFIGWILFLWTANFVK